MATVRILKTDISVTNINEVSEVLISEKKIFTAICNANTLVRCYKDENLNKTINSFSIKCPDGFPVAKASKILYKNNQERVDGYKLFLETIKAGLNPRIRKTFVPPALPLPCSRISIPFIILPAIILVGVDPSI